MDVDPFFQRMTRAAVLFCLGAAGLAFLLSGNWYALLAVLAYVMIARLRLHPIGLLIGASSLVASAALEAGRVLTRMRVL
jgi:hypothetical protein